MATTPPKLDSGSVRGRLEATVKAHGAIRHRARERTAAGYAEIAERARSDALKTPAGS